MMGKKDLKVLDWLAESKGFASESEYIEYIRGNLPDNYEGMLAAYYDMEERYRESLNELENYEKRDKVQKVLIGMLTCFLAISIYIIFRLL